MSADKGDDRLWLAKEKWIKRVMASRNLKSGAKLLAWEINSRAWGERLECWPGRGTIQEDLGLRSTGRVARDRKELIQAGAISTELVYTGERAWTKYTILLDYSEHPGVSEHPGAQ